ncbi:MAG: hypothetical protein GX207_00465 [Peptococcaceae bacterium]|nr:hypothetical protein [Peptococcaceae bacterium]
MSTALNIENQVMDYKRQIINSINNIPQDPKFSGKNFRMSLKNSADNWKNFYNNNRIQAKALANIIQQKDSIEDIKSLLRTIANKGYYQISESHKLYFNEQVRKHISKRICFNF